MKKLLPIILLLFGSVLHASIDDFIELDKESYAEFEISGQEADVWFGHRDFFEGKDAPIIRLKIYTIEEDGFESVGAYSPIVESLRGKSDKFQMLLGQAIASAVHASTSEIFRVTEFELFEESLALVFIVDYMFEEDVYQQHQIQQWAEDGRSKCVIASDSSERVADFYQDSITDALIDLMSLCSFGLNADGEVLWES